MKLKPRSPSLLLLLLLLLLEYSVPEYAGCPVRVLFRTISGVSKITEFRVRVPEFFFLLVEPHQKSREL